MQLVAQRQKNFLSNSAPALGRPCFAANAFDPKWESNCLRKRYPMRSRPKFVLGLPSGRLDAIHLYGWKRSSGRERTTLTLGPAKLSRRHTEEPPKMTRHVALVGKTGRERHLRQRPTRSSKHLPSSVNAPLHEIVVRGDTRRTLKFSCEVVNRDSRHSC
jgi:hypothetical protein